MDAVPTLRRQLTIALVTALVVAPTLARGRTLLPPPLPRPAPVVRSAPATPGPKVAPAAVKPLNMVRNAPEELGRVPDHFFWLRAGLQAAQDPVDGQLVFFTDQGRIVGRVALPAGFVIDKVVGDERPGPPARQSRPSAGEHRAQRRRCWRQVAAGAAGDGE